MMKERSQKEGTYFDMIYAVLDIKDQVDLSKVLLAKWDRDFLKRLIEVTADPETGKVPISQEKLAKLAKVSQKTISNILDPETDPRFQSIQKVGEALGIHFVADYNGSINNEVVLAELVKRNQKR